MCSTPRTGGLCVLGTLCAQGKHGGAAQLLLLPQSLLRSRCSSVYQAVAPLIAEYADQPGFLWGYILQLLLCRTVFLSILSLLRYCHTA